MAATLRVGFSHRLRMPAGLRFAANILVSVSLGLSVVIVGPGLGAHQALELPPDCFSDQTKINLVFIIDRSGSLANTIDPPHEGNRGRGQTYNVEIAGVRRALLSPTVIPRDGSVAVGAVLFDGEAVESLPLTDPISSDTQAIAIAAHIETLRCSDGSIGRCPSGDTNFDAAIRQADQIARLRKGARRVFIMSTDGEATDPDRGVSASSSLHENARKDGVEAELDVILMGLREDELIKNKPIVEGIVFPTPPDDLPGAVEVIDKSHCNEPNAIPDQRFEEECECQVRQFADFSRRALRSNVSPLNLTVGTFDDPKPNTPVAAGGAMSLRQAIETANRSGGSAKITFLTSGTIHPRLPLPALTAPDITICGCAGDCGDSIADELTCQQTSQRQKNECERGVTIDGQRSLADGILIRSNRDIVRGLMIKNFTHAGIVIRPVCPSDNTGFNRIENNKLENNTSAGICVLDPPRDQAFAVAHNIGNTFSMNDIFGSMTPIDLGGDGPTGNDACDADQGPNTLINFPRITSVTQSNGAATVKGHSCDPNCTSQVCPSEKLIGGVVEIFAVTEFASQLTEASTDKRAVTGVMFLAKGAIDASGSFTIDTVRESQTAAYTATVTDRDGNTSELLFACAGLAKANTPDQIMFGNVESNGPPIPITFTIRNDGCDRLLLVSFSIKRTGGDIGKKKNRDDDSDHFSIDEPSAKADPPMRRFDPVITIDPGQSRSFTVLFNPAIPGCVLLGKKLRAADTLPENITSTLTLNHSGGASDIRLQARVSPKLRLLSPNCSQPIKPPLVTLTKSGDDELTVRYSVFDSNMNVNTVDYVFFKKDGDNRCTQEALKEPDEVLIVDRNLSGPIRERGLVKGQSFSVLQPFSNANQHPEVGCVQIRVTDGETTVSATSDPLGSSPGAVGIQSSRGLAGTVLVLPNVRALPRSRTRFPVIKPETGLKTPNQRSSNVRRTP